ncbi:atrial natriuretic peptide receptor 1-like, partial [Limulus polyphemus]|uniref:guanylate cyclase n=1 Tax=Limulus polyphemus TaxID=6850 RepID=A0ABM1TJF8_LIMPO
MRSAVHENLNHFVGICPEVPNVAFLSDYHHRGTLRDLLDNDAIKVDWPFRFSVITDICEGMLYLHNSPIAVHGSLKSTNCVIDGRFVVKLENFGLCAVKEQVMPPEEINPRSLFWTAPEHLRNRTSDTNRSQAGDVYSFAIILQEIITRTEPFEPVEKDGVIIETIEAKDILQKVKNITNPPFRPTIPTDDCSPDLMSLISDCWNEDPTARPKFPVIKQKIKKNARGSGSTNFLDNLLTRMEQYAENLERLVEEKTSAFLDEKKKSEELLYQVLPR